MERLAGALAEVRTRPLDERIAGAPISWGACEVPGWGLMPDAESVLDALARHGYDGWLVLEQDTAITGDEPPVGREPIVDVRESIAFLHNSALRTQEVI